LSYKRLSPYFLLPASGALSWPGPEFLAFVFLVGRRRPAACRPATAFAGDISAPKLTFRFGAAARPPKKDG